MKLICEKCMCTGKPEPREWTMDDREGITYRVEISDGTGNVSLQCDGVEVYEVFEPFAMYEVEIELIPTNYEGRRGTKSMIVYADRVEADA